MEEGKKIIVDEDWKKQVEDEKRHEEPEEKEGVSEPSFTMFISSLATQTLIHLGDIDNPISKKNEKNLDQAKYMIDILQIINDKTKGNLTDEEKRYMDTLLYDLRMRYLQNLK